jgi:predicted metal-dependent hydrolase
MLAWLKADPRKPHFLELGDTSLPLVIRRLSCARRMTLRLSPDGSEVRLSIPQWGRTAEAIAFAESRRDWLTGQLAAQPRAVPLAHGSTLRFRGEDLSIVHDPGLPRKPRLDAGSVCLGGPVDSIAPRLKRWLEKEARSLLAADLAEYCEQLEKPIGRLSLSSARRRWGSCSPSGAIRINWRLVMAPDFVRRSVVAHEVAHLVHFDHSPGFHALLRDLFEGDMAAANAWLKREGRKLYQPFG